MKLIFYYWFNDEFGKTHRVVRDGYVGDIGDPINHMGKTYIITNWITEEEDMA